MAPPPYGLPDGSPGRCVGGRLGGRRRSRRTPNGPQMIENLRNMGDAVGFWGKPKEKIVVLTAVESLLKTADFLEKAAAKQAEVSDIVAGEQQVRVPRGLEERICCHSFHPDLVLIGVYQIESRILVQAFDDFGQRVRRQFVIVIQKPNKLPGGEGQSMVGCPRDALIGFEVFRMDSRVGGGVAL